MRVTSLFGRGTFLLFFIFLITSAVSYAQRSINPPSGIAVLFDVSNTPIRAHLPLNTRPLLTSNEQESFLRELEGNAPQWPLLHDEPWEEHGQRLFALNRARDRAREGHRLLSQRIAFLWSGLLRTYIPEHQGFSVAMGPELTQTSWGIVRFKPVVLPDEMIAVPSPWLKTSLQKQLEQGEQIEIKILLSGRLVQDESIVYAFSHDGSGEGMIMPVVWADEVEYFIH